MQFLQNIQLTWLDLAETTFDAREMCIVDVVNVVRQIKLLAIFVWDQLED